MLSGLNFKCMLPVWFGTFAANRWPAVWVACLGHSCGSETRRLGSKLGIHWRIWTGLKHMIYKLVLGIMMLKKITVTAASNLNHHRRPARRWLTKPWRVSFQVMHKIITWPRSFLCHFPNYWYWHFNSESLARFELLLKYVKNIWKSVTPIFGLSPQSSEWWVSKQNMKEQSILRSMGCCHYLFNFVTWHKFFKFANGNVDWLQAMTDAVTILSPFLYQNYPRFSSIFFPFFCPPVGIESESERTNPALRSKISFWIHFLPPCRNQALFLQPCVHVTRPWQCGAWALETLLQLAQIWHQ